MMQLPASSPNIAGGLHVSTGEMEVGAGDQEIMIGYASDETEDCMVLIHPLATKLGKTLTDVEYKQNADGPVELLKNHIVLLSMASMARLCTALRTSRTSATSSFSDRLSPVHGAGDGFGTCLACIQ